MARKRAEKVLHECSTSSIGQPLPQHFALMLFFLAKVLRCHKSIGILVGRGLSSEAASIATTQFEVRLDALFLRSDSQRMADWLSHRNPYREPWRAVEKIGSLFGVDTPKADWNREVFKILSQCKHGNPLAAEFVFPHSIDGGKLSMDLGSRSGVYPEFMAVFVTAASSYHVADVCLALHESLTEVMHVDARSLESTNWLAGTALKVLEAVMTGFSDLEAAKAAQGKN